VLSERGYLRVAAAGAEAHPIYWAWSEADARGGLNSNRLELLEDGSPGKRCHGVLVGYSIKSLFVSETGQSCTRVGPVVLVVLQPVLQSLVGLIRGTGGTTMKDCRSVRPA
jgi:hypothetical protein